MRKIKTKLTDFCYFLSDNEPEILIHAGTHGDEYEVIELVEMALKKYERRMRPFLFVPAVSPSAVSQRTRKSINGLDMNRDFTDSSSDFEIRANMDLLTDKRFDLFVSFHEDPGLREYYIYDVGYSKAESKKILEHNKYLKENGVKLLNGVDDPEDPFLGYEFIDGYLKFVHPEDYHDDGTISAWALNRHICDEYLCPEIPGKLSLEIKKEIVDSFFEKILLREQGV